MFSLLLLAYSHQSHWALHALNIQACKCQTIYIHGFSLNTLYKDLPKKKVKWPFWLSNINNVFTKFSNILRPLLKTFVGHFKSNVTIRRIWIKLNVLHLIAAGSIFVDILHVHYFVFLNRPSELSYGIYKILKRIHILKYIWKNSVYYCSFISY